MDHEGQSDIARGLERNEVAATEVRLPEEASVGTRIDIVSDAICPWCYIGKRHFEQALAQFNVANLPQDLGA